MPQGSQATKGASGRRDLAVTEGQVWVAADGESTSLGKQHLSGMCGDRVPGERARSINNIHTWLIRQGGSAGMLPKERSEEASWDFKERTVLFYSQVFVSGKMKPGSRENRAQEVIKRCSGLKWRMWNEIWWESRMYKKRLEKLMCAFCLHNSRGLWIQTLQTSSSQDEKPNEQSHLSCKHNWA